MYVTEYITQKYPMKPSTEKQHTVLTYRY
jgi:hypothetical protein